LFVVNYLKAFALMIVQVVESPWGRKLLL